jgi:hypothetical protein
MLHCTGLICSMRFENLLHLRTAISRVSCLIVSYTMSLSVMNVGLGPQLRNPSAQGAAVSWRQRGQVVDSTNPPQRHAKNNVEKI